MKKIVFVSLALLTTNLFATGLSKPVWVGPKAIGMGGAFVGVADDTTSIFHNPAGMTQLKYDHNFQVGADTLITQLDYTPPGGAPTESAHRQYLPVPTFAYVNRQMKLLSFGLGVFFPHGNGGKFDTPSAAPGNPNEGRIYSMEIDPAVAFQIIPEISIGAALRITRISETLKGQLVVLDPTVPVIDNLTDFNVSGWGYGAAAGILIQPTSWLRLGGNYRSKIKKTLSGNGTFATAGNFDADYKAVLPTLITGGFSAQVQKLLVSFQYDFERNSEIENFNVTSPNLGGAPATLNLPENWRDSHTYHFGAKYDACKHMSVIAGYARDFNKSVPDNVNNRIVGDIDADEVSGGLLFNVGRYNAGVAWNGRYGQRFIPNNGVNVAPGKYDAFINTVSANIGVGL